MDDAHTKPIDEVIGFFKTDEIIGLSDEQVQSAQEKYGPNGKCDTTDACILYVMHTVSPGFQAFQVVQWHQLRSMECMLRSVADAYPSSYGHVPYKSS